MTKVKNLNSVKQMENQEATVAQDNTIKLALSKELQEFIAKTNNDIALLNAIFKARMEGFVEGSKYKMSDVAGLSEDGQFLLIKAESEVTE